MSYSTKKGYDAEKEIEQFLNSIFEPFGIKWARVGGTERNKKVLAGDVAIVRGREKQCVLGNYLIEVKRHARLDLWSFVEKARDDAKWWNKKSYILFAEQQARGEKVGFRKVVIMDYDTFGDIVRELQGYYEIQSPKG
jgi:hypothetical protein